MTTHKRAEISRRLCKFEILELRGTDQRDSKRRHTERRFHRVSGFFQLRACVPHQTAAPVGITPFQIQSAYGFYTGTQAAFGNTYDPITGKQLTTGTFNNNIKLSGGKIGDGSGMTIAIVDPGNDPTIASDVQAFSKQFGLPLFNTTGANQPGVPTFKVVNEHGSTNPLTLPNDDFDAAVEISLDVEWAHAIAPKANIVLVEAVSFNDIFIAENYARSIPGVVVVSNSWGGNEFLGEQSFDNSFITPPGHVPETFVFSAGDSGGPASYPSSSPNVLSIGGTKLNLSATNKYASESVWNELTLQEGAGGGGESGGLFQDPVSGRIFLDQVLEKVPTFQKNITINGTPLTGRGTPDVSWDADPQSGFAVYDSFTFGTKTPWDQVGGTQRRCASWSAMLAIVDQGRALVGKASLSNAQAVMYSLPNSDFHDITVGNNDYIGLGLGVSGNAAGPGYDLASGIGTPIANLVIRDLVASTGTTFVPTLGGAGGAASGFFAKQFKRFDELGGGSDASSGGGELAAAGGAVDLSGVGDAELSDPAAAVSDAEIAGLGNAASQASDATSVDLGSTLSAFGRRSRHGHEAGSDANVDAYFAELDNSILTEA